MKKSMELSWRPAPTGAVCKPKGKKGVLATIKGLLGSIFNSG